MDESPKRTRAEMIGQLLVILALMAILVGAIFFLHDYVTSHTSAPTTGNGIKVIAGLRSALRG